ncbi:orotidine 5'-phosphate decarboxylase / HUMPS family protein [Nocardia cyriacigeorgica]|uniref:orotidine 5'-phosphate decarboxylase / HUMPS family protein n=1 Tax=Nocardia cyriacigeorgica TaxID=135487 RepID=UPI001895CFAB|nr:orotidine 5'-phosphate decarboxylase / HUMPS family protein [Nocardia cyriacigeorgica]MBF6456027.1 HEAT repeat domain-containing protein [Nocardia cyriacigeorgica]MBF6553232.1 HEAT repeat domain-containing protein [Nocardia cyriacigeorgica]
MASVVARWTGYEARALREATRMSVREFAAHLGVNDAAVSNWERRGIEAKLRYETQQILDTELARSGPDVVARFEFILQHEAEDTPLGTGPIPNQSATSGPDFGLRSRRRTAALLDTATPVLMEVPYRVDDAAVGRFRQFLASTARVFVIAGGVGSGKTCLSQHLVRECRETVDFQLHLCQTWVLPTTDLATEVLRYSSLSSGDDALLTLERVVGALASPCVVVIDGISSEEHLSFVGRQVDGILRQTDSHHLRFVLVVRTPPELDLSPFPILAASTFRQISASPTASYTLAPWTMTETREWWDGTRRNSQIPFSRLPGPLQSLASIPLYSQLLHSAGEPLQEGIRNGPANGFRLVDHCVRTILGRNAQPIEPTIESLIQVARALDPNAIPPSLTTPSQKTNYRAEPPQPTPLFVERASDGGARFAHDIFRAYFLATWISDRLAETGRSAATVIAFNELAVRASQSAAARNVFDFVVCALDSRAHHLIEVIALAPSITMDVALPMLLETMATNGVLAEDAIRSSAHRCTQSQALTKAVLATPNLPEILGDQHAPWVVEQLRTHGSQLWPSIAKHVEDALNVEISTRIVSCIDLDSPAEAAFLARYFDLFTNAGHDPFDLLQQLVRNLDWRVRAALAESLPGRGTLSPPQVNSLIEQLAGDYDYKVRAGLARAISALDTAACQRVLRLMLTDNNWHVREQALQSITAARQNPVPDPAFTDQVLAIISTDKSWLRPPVHVAKLITRIHMLSGTTTRDLQVRENTGLIGLLKEVRSGWITLPPEREQALVRCGQESSHWLVAREAEAVRRRHESGTPSIQEWYRRRRGRRSLQVALDVHSLDRATEIAYVAVEADVDFIEVGDPLIKREGIAAIEAIKQCAPDTAVVAEMMSADWGRDQVELAADVILLIGPASMASVSTAVAAARRLGVALTLDATPEHATPAWLRDMERTGIDGFVVTTNIDLGVGSNHPLATAAAVRRYSQLPVAVSGGFSPGDDALSSDEWDIAIIGRSIADAVAPADTAGQLATLARKIRAKEHS